MNISVLFIMSSSILSGVFLQQLSRQHPLLSCFIMALNTNPKNKCATANKISVSVAVGCELRNGNRITQKEKLSILESQPIHH